MVIALQEEGTRFGFIAIKSAAGGSGDLHVIVIQLAITQDCNAPADESDIKRRPFAQAEFSASGWRIVAVDGAHFVVGLRTALSAYLDLVASPQIDAAIAVLGTIDLDVKLEVL